MDNREEQIRLAEQLIATGIDGELKKAIENQFPELKESEDEKIRKVLLKYFNERNNYRDEDETFNGVPFPSIIAYLEKQSPTEDVIKNITKNKEAATKFLKSAGIMDDNGELAEKYRSEQKSAEWNSEDELFRDNIITYLSLRKDRNLPEDTKYPVLDAWIDWLKSLGPWPKEEWSEEDEQYLLVCKNALNKYQRSDNWDASIISNWLENRLKSLRPLPHQEWSEGTKKMLDEISDYLKYKGREEDADFIRHLRPQPQWKPSEEQMKALEQAMDRNDKLGYLLRELHDKLKNL